MARNTATITETAAIMPEQVIEERRSDPNARVYVSRIGDDGKRRSLGAEGSFEIASFQLADIADRFGGGEYFVQVVSAGNFAGGAQFEWSVDPSVRARPKAPPPPAMPTAQAYPQQGASPDAVSALRAEFAAMTDKLAEAITRAQRPRTVAEMTEAEFAALMNRSQPQQAREQMSLEQMFSLWERLQQKAGPRSGFEEGLNAWKTIESLRGSIERGEATEESGGGSVVAEIIKLVREDPLLRKGIEKFIDSEREEEPAQRKPVHNEAGRPQQPAAPQRAELAPGVEKYVPQLVEALKLGFAVDTALKVNDVARNIVEKVEDLPALQMAFDRTREGNFALAIIQADPATFKPRTAWLVRLEAAVRALVDLKTSEDQEDDGNDQDDAAGDEDAGGSGGGAA